MQATEPSNVIEVNGGKTSITVYGIQTVNVRKSMQDADESLVTLVISDTDRGWVNVSVELRLPSARALRDRLIKQIKELTQCTCGENEACASCEIRVIAALNVCPICQAVESPPAKPDMPHDYQWYCALHQPETQHSQQVETETLEEYLNREGDEGKIDFSLRVYGISGGGPEFYVHPTGKDGKTLDFRVTGNLLELIHLHTFAGEEGGYRCICGVVRQDRDDWSPPKSKEEETQRVARFNG
jgi:hypothetical protein